MRGQNTACRGGLWICIIMRRPFRPCAIFWGAVLRGVCVSVLALGHLVCPSARV